MTSTQQTLASSSLFLIKEEILLMFPFNLRCIVPRLSLLFDFSLWERKQITLIGGFQKYNQAWLAQLFTCSFWEFLCLPHYARLTWLVPLLLKIWKLSWFNSSRFICFYIKLHLNSASAVLWWYSVTYIPVLGCLNLFRIYAEKKPPKLPNILEMIYSELFFQTFSCSLLLFRNERGNQVQI